MTSSNTIPIVLGSLLGVMLAVLCIVLLLFYKKRNESIDVKPQIEKMTRGLKKMSRNVMSQSQKSVNRSRNSLPRQPAIVLQDTRFWVPEVYNSIVQPSLEPLKKMSRLQSTLDQEIYSKALDTSYLQATDNCEVYEANPKRKTIPAIKRPHLVREQRHSDEPLNNGMLNFSIEYKQDIATLYIVVLKAEGLRKRHNGEACNPFLYVKVMPAHKLHKKSEVHQNTVNPVFNKIFTFGITKDEIHEQTIVFNMLNFHHQYDNWNHENCNNYKNIGNVFYKLDTLDRDALHAGKRFTLWNKLEMADDKTRESNTYDECPRMDVNVTHRSHDNNNNDTEMLLLLSTQYVKHNEQVNVCVIQVRNLPLHDRKGTVDNPYMSVSLKHAGQVVKKVRISIAKDDITPVYNVIFNKNIQFVVCEHPVEQMTLTIKLRHHSEVGRDRTFAILKIGKEAVGAGYHQWRDMVNSGETLESECIERWHTLKPIEPLSILNPIARCTMAGLQ